MIGSKFKTKCNVIIEPLARVLVKLGVTPNQLTITGLLLGVLACFILICTRNVGLFAFLILLFGCFDALDGPVARVSGRATKYGSYLDAMCDRLYDGMVALTVAYISGEWGLISLLVVGSFLVSYAKARAGMEVPVSNLEWPDLMERAERDILFVLGFTISHYLYLPIAGHDLFVWILVVLNALVYFTVFQRMNRAKQIIRSRQ